MAGVSRPHSTLAVLILALVALGLATLWAPATPVPASGDPTRRERWQSVDPWSVDATAGEPGSPSRHAARTPVAAEAILSRVEVRGQLAESADGDLIADCEVVLFLEKVRESDDEARIQRQLTTRTDSEGRFEFAVAAAPGTEWRAALLPHRVGHWHGAIPFVVEANRPVDFRRITLGPNSELRAGNRTFRQRGLVEAMFDAMTSQRR